MNIIFSLLLTFLGIISLILGILNLSKNINNANSKRFEQLVKRFTNNSIMCFLVGIIITILAQSSGAVTLISLTLLNNQKLTKKQTLLIILGANIGTTVSSIIIGFQFKYLYLLFFIIGFLFLYIIKKDNIKLIGKILICLGLIFLGLEIMEKGLNLLILNEKIYAFILSFSDIPLLNLFLGIFVSALIQSSSASIAMIQNFYYLDLIKLSSAISFVLGANTGTTLIGFLGLVTKNKDVLVVSTINLLFNLIGGIIFFIFIKQYSNLILILSNILSINKFHMISLSHFLFNFITAVFFGLIILLYKEKSNSCVL